MDTQGAISIMEDIGYYMESRDDKITHLEAQIDIKDDIIQQQQQDIQDLQDKIDDLQDIIKDLRSQIEAS